MTEAGIQLLVPPYRGFVPYDPASSPPTGAIALTPPLEEILVTERTMRSIARRAPWIPIAVWTTAEGRNQLDLSLQSMRLLTGAHAALVVPVGGGHPSVAEVLEAVARRTPPMAEQVAEWCASRLGRPDLGEDLALAMRPRHRLPSPADDRALRRRMAREGLPPRLALGQVVALAGCYRLHQTVSDMAARLGFNTAQLRTWLERLAGTTAERWLQQPGWEWVMEEMVRRHGAQAARQPLVPAGPPSSGLKGLDASGASPP